jgi:hypothetical protein
MTLIIGSNGAYHWAGENSGFAVLLLAALAASWLCVLARHPEIVLIFPGCDSGNQ